MYCRILILNRKTHRAEWRIHATRSILRVCCKVHHFKYKISRFWYISRFQYKIHHYYLLCERWLGLQNPSFLMQNSSFLAHNFSFLLQNSSVLLTASSGKAADGKVKLCVTIDKWAAKHSENSEEQRKLLRIPMEMASFSVLISIEKSAISIKIRSKSSWCDVKYLFTPLIVSEVKVKVWTMQDNN